VKKVNRGQSGVRRVERGLVVNDDNDDGTQRDLDRGGGGGATCGRFALLSVSRWFRRSEIQLDGAGGACSVM